MGSSGTMIIIYGVLLALLGVVYWLLQKRDVFGAKSNKASGLLNGFIAKPVPAQPESGGAVEEAVAVLDDMYREFSNEIRLLRHDMDARLSDLQTRWEADREAVEARLTRLEQQPSSGVTSHEVSEAHATPEHELTPTAVVSEETWSPPEEPSGFDTRYFEVYDRLSSGETPSSIAHAMGLNPSDIQRVLAILKLPPSDVQ